MTNLQRVEHHVIHGASPLRGAAGGDRANPTVPVTTTRTHLCLKRVEQIALLVYKHHFIPIWMSERPPMIERLRLPAPPVAAAPRLHGLSPPAPPPQLWRAGGQVAGAIA